MTPTTSKQELIDLNRSIVDTAGVPDTPLKLVTIKILKMINCKIMLKATKI